jgi:16S rRNA C967 or C1407 C5-methylase (RsmB/RsmF family)
LPPKPSPLSADALLVAPIAVNQLPGFAGGALSVLDLSAQCAADALAPASGARVLDACAAPGGKSAHLLNVTRPCSCWRWISMRVAWRVPAIPTPHRCR